MPAPSWWTPERVHILTDEWMAGATALAISLLLGVTRNTIMGKVSRLREQGLLQDGGRKVNGPHKRYRAPPIVFGRIPTSKALKPAVPPPVRHELPPAEGLSIMELQDHHCRAILGQGTDGTARYCGHPKSGWEYRGTMIRTSYCEHHNVVHHNH